MAPRIPESAGRRRAIRAVVVAIVVLALAAIGGALWWAMTPLGPDAAALAALKSGPGVTVTDAGGLIAFSPSRPSTVGVLIYPGGRVDARSYARLARGLAADGHLTIIVKMPLSLAVLSPNAGDAALAAYPAVRSWVVTGHSLGGSMAARFASARRDKVEGLVFLAAYAESGLDLRDTGLIVADVVGSRDSVLNRANWTSGSERLPVGTELVTIPGGNHAQFGDYGPQPGDTPASISAEAQQARAIRAIERVALLVAER